MVKKNYDLIVAKPTAADRESLDLLRRAKRLNPEVRIMLVSSSREAGFPLEAYELEVDDYLQMPLSPPELWRRVNRCLEDRGVVDLQPVRGAAVSFGSGALSGPQMMLLSHDIRGSMVATASALKLMARGTYGAMSEAAKTKIREATSRIENTIHLIEDFIGSSLSARRPGTGEVEILDVSEDIVEPELAELAAEIRDQQITLVNRLPHQGESKVPVRGGRVWLKSVFRNLINNGIKHGGRGCTIVVDLEIQGSACRLNVYNTGKTVPEAYHSMLFSYGRSRSQSKKAGRGLGIGLSLSRDIIQNYGGDIWYEAKKDGSNFVMSLPQR
jgi:signal transduction histidine kinase